jgi:Zn ribbon nucleic-acid-binding protein
MTDLLIGIIILLIVGTAFIVFLRNYIKKFVSKGICPNCDARDYKRVKRDIITKYLLFFVSVQTLKCTKCSYQFNLKLKTKKQLLS